MSHRNQNIDNALQDAYMRPVRIKRGRHFEEDLDGLVVGMSSKLVLLHNLHLDFMDLNGYICLRRTDIRKIVPRYEGEDDGFVENALRQKGIIAETLPEISLENWPALLRQANEKFPLLNLHFEKKWPDTCYIGEVLELTKKRVTLRHIDPGARWDKNDTYDLKDLTRVDFGDGYSSALWGVAHKMQRVSSSY